MAALANALHLPRGADTTIAPNPSSAKRESAALSWFFSKLLEQFRGGGVPMGMHYVTPGKEETPTLFDWLLWMGQRSWLC